MSKKILIVEDEKSLREALVEKLTHEQFTVFSATQGEEGIALALQEKPDIILLDIIMPVMDGLTMLKKLREDSWGKTVQVIMLTNLSDDEKLHASQAAGVFEYLIKTDWTLEDLVKVINKKLT